MKNLANGSAKIIASTTGWDINPRVLGTVPKEAKIGTLQGFHWVTDAHYAVVPKGVSTDKQAAVLALLAWVLTPEQQAKAYDKGYFYPGPAIKDVPLSMAPADSRKVIEEYGRQEYDSLIAGNPLEVPLDAKSLVEAFSRWDREIGGGKVAK
jgi:putative spermidine/putrescine transport system substrate-binding protein